MKKKIKVGLISILLVFLVFTPACQANETTSKNKYVNLSHGLINIYYDSEAVSVPIIPMGILRVIPLNISYNVVGLFANTIVKLLNLRGFAIPVPIKLSIEEKPDWCAAIINPSTVFILISNGESKSQATLFVSVNLKAPAYKLSTIKIKAESDPIKRFFGVLTLVSKAEAECDVPIIPDYLPLINIILNEGNFKRVIPGQQANFNITIENIGNGKTNIISEVLEKPQNWSVSLPSNVIIDVNESTEIQLNFITDENFTGEKIIKVAFTPNYYENPLDKDLTDILIFAIEANT